VQDTLRPQVDISIILALVTNLSHAEGFEITATPQVGILFTAALLEQEQA